ncbi:MAG: CpaF family protein, partial [Candidatus Dormibacteraeota bacterium]|nr:CpaF family protein [Candidatus Dormibacteraeota bacterium]
TAACGRCCVRDSQQAHVLGAQVRVTVHFSDGERIEGDSGAMTLSKMGFPMVPDGGNNVLLWVSVSAIKYVLIHAGNLEKSEHGDPRAGADLPKIVIRFHDGEVIRTYRDDSWGQEGEGFKLRLWDSRLRILLPALVSLHAVKGIFFVKEWDSRTPGEKLARSGRLPAAAAEASPAAQLPGQGGGRIEQLARSYRARLARIRDPRMDDRTPGEFSGAVTDHLTRLLAEDGLTLPPDELHELSEIILRNAFRYGPLDSLLADPTVSEIMVNGHRHVFVERNGKLQSSKRTFSSDHELLEVIRRMAGSIGRRIDETSPMVDARLPDGSRINAVIPPASVDGPTLTIRKFTKFLSDMGDLIKQDTLNLNMALFLQQAVLGGANLLITGGTGSGKTTTLNVLGSLIPADQRVITIEDTAELQLAHPHVVRLEYRGPNVEGEGELTIRQLLRNSLRMRPDRIIVGEVRGAEALEMLQAMNTGHDGSMSTIHANSAIDALARLETMVLSASIDLPLEAVRAQIVSAVDLIIHQVRRPDGKRKILEVSELRGYAGGLPVLRQIFVFEADSDHGQFRATGVKPRCLEKLARQGVPLADGILETWPAAPALPS